MSRPITPQIAADTIIRLVDQSGSPIVLIERKNSPYGWAIPGGFVDVGETIEHAAIREAREETCLEVQLVVLLGLYSNPERDKRGHTVTAVYVADTTGTPKAADDAKNYQLVLPEQLPAPLAFDHALILADYAHYLNTGKTAPLR